MLVISREGITKDGHSAWNCICDCGQRCIKKSANLISGITKSCGCLRIESHKTHGLRHDPIFQTWNEILRRCYKPKRKQFKDYGGRGIVACEFIRASPVNLLALIGPKSNPELSLDRINNNGSYTCGHCAECNSKGWVLNVRWANRKTQNRNRKYVHRVSINGIVHCPGEWAELTGIKYRTIKARMARGFKGVDLIKTPKPNS